MDLTRRADRRGWAQVHADVRATGGGNVDYSDGFFNPYVPPGNKANSRLELFVHGTGTGTQAVWGFDAAAMPRTPRQLRTLAQARGYQSIDLLSCNLGRESFFTLGGPRRSFAQEFATSSRTLVRASTGLVDVPFGEAGRWVIPMPGRRMLVFHQDPHTTWLYRIFGY
jgi:hypothetical protein